jgi:tetratricopeptide (TPR) repeat protein
LDRAEAIHPADNGSPVTPPPDESPEALDSQAKAHELRGQFELALPLRERALQLREAELGPGDWRVATARASLAETQLLAQLSDDQRRRLAQAQFAHNRMSRAFSYRDYLQARALAQDALRIRRQVLGHSPTTAATLQDLANLHGLLGENSRAESASHEAVLIWRSVVGDQHPLYAAAVLQWGQCLANVGQSDQAALAMREALGVWQALGMTAPGQAALESLGTVYLTQDRLPAAGRLFRQALETTPPVQPAGILPPDTSALTRLACTSILLGDGRAAVTLQRRALAATGEQPGDPAFAEELWEYGRICQLAGQFDEAIGAYGRVLEIHRQGSLQRKPADSRAAGSKLARHNPQSAQALAALAAIDRQHGRLEPARLRINQAAETWKQLHGENDARYAAALHEHAQLLELRNEPAHARHLYERALRSYEQGLGAEHPATAACFGHAGRLHLRGGHPEAARAAAERALKTHEALVELGPVSLPPRQRLALLNSHREALGIWVSAALAAHQPPGEIYRHVLLCKFAAAGGPAFHLPPGAAPQVAAAWESLRVARARLLYVAVAVPPPGQLEAWRKELATLRQHYDQRQRDWLAVAPPPQRSSLPPADEREIVRALGPDEVFVEFLEYVDDRPPPPAPPAAPTVPGATVQDAADNAKPADNSQQQLPTGGGASPKAEGGAAATPSGQKEPGADKDKPSPRSPPAAPRKMLAFVLRQGLGVAMVPLGDAAVLAQDAAAWRTALKSGKAADLTAAADRLARAVWRPLAPLVSDASRVLVALDGSLHDIPLGALPGTHPGTIVLDERAIGYVTSGRQIVELRRRSPGPTSRPAGEPGEFLLLSGTETRPSDPAEPAPRPSGNPAAPAAGPIKTSDDRQTAGLASELRGRFQRAFPGENFTALAGPAATESRCRQALARQPGYFHFAGPGLFLPPTSGQVAAARPTAAEPSPLSSILWNDGPARGAELRWHPWRRTGLALWPQPDAHRGLADASFAWLEGYDGILLGEELAGLDLRGTRLVFLSACDTAAGGPPTSEGLQGLQAAFHHAGAAAVVASLWRVEDAAAEVIIDEFYNRLWNEQLPPLEALRQAQLTVRAHPELVEKRRELLQAADKTNRAKPPPDAPKTPKQPPAAPGTPAAGAPATSSTAGKPSLHPWAAFVLCGDWL